MRNKEALFQQDIRVINLGLEGFSHAIKEQNIPVQDIDWQPPADGDVHLINILKAIYYDQVLFDKINNANEIVIERIQNANPKITDITSAQEAMNLPPFTILHAGPPVSWERMCGPQRRAILGAIQFENWAKNEIEALEFVTKEKVELSPCHRFNAVGPMTGVISPSMPVLVIQNETYGNYGYSTFNEGRGNTLWFGVYDKNTHIRLKWIQEILGPAMKVAINKNGPINVFDILEQGVQMGDECHARHAASTALFVKKIIPAMLDGGVSGKTVSSIIRFIDENSHFFLNFTLASVKATMDGAHNIPYSTIVTAMSRNGVDFMLRISGLGNKWVLSPVSKMERAVYYTGFTVEDAAGDIGDSAIIETCGLGGMSIASAPSLAPFLGGRFLDEVVAIRDLDAITVATHNRFRMPAMDSRNTPLGIDLRKVVETRITPFITTGVLHDKNEEIGQIGTGIADAPVNMFDNALTALAYNWDLETKLPNPENTLFLEPE